MESEKRDIFSNHEKKSFRSGSCVGGEACVWYEMSMVRERVYSDKKLAEILLASLPCSCQSETPAQG